MNVEVLNEMHYRIVQDSQIFGFTKSFSFIYM